MLDIYLHESKSDENSRSIKTVSQEKNVELYSLEEIDLEGVLSKCAIPKAFFHWRSETIGNLTGMVLVHLFPLIQPGSAELALSLRRAEIEQHVKGFSYPGAVPKEIGGSGVSWH